MFFSPSFFFHFWAFYLFILFCLKCTLHEATDFVLVLLCPRCLTEALIKMCRCSINVGRTEIIIIIVNNIIDNFAHPNIWNDFIWQMLNEPFSQYIKDHASVPQILSICNFNFQILSFIKRNHSTAVTLPVYQISSVIRTLILAIWRSFWTFLKVSK